MIREDGRELYMTLQEVTSIVQDRRVWILESNLR